jgi:rare lipoprotein A
MRFGSLSDGLRLFGTGTLLTLVLIFACAGREVPSTPIASTAPSPDSVPMDVQLPVQNTNYRETGIASWYGRELHGKLTANGEVFDMYGLSAAHRTLPLGAVVRVTNLDNFKSITVRINDRGPFIKSRFLDLSYGAARELGFVSQGTARVRIETMEALRDTIQYTVQAAVFTEEENAKMLKERLDSKFGEVSIVPFETSIAMFYLVRVGVYDSEDHAEQAARKLTFEGLEPIVVRRD